MKKINITKHHVFLGFKSFFWFGVGAILGLFFSISFAYILFQRMYGEKIYPGVYVNTINLGSKTELEAEKYFSDQNDLIGPTTFTFTYQDQIATVSAKDLHMGYNSKLLAHQAYDIGRSNYLLSDIILVFKSYLYGLSLSPSYTYSEDTLRQAIEPIVKKATIEPQNALFTFNNGRVVAFRLSSNGQGVNIDTIKQAVISEIPSLIAFHKPQSLVIDTPIAVIKPKISTGNANRYGIQELIGTGDSYYGHSIPSRIYNVGLAASRMNGVLIAPNEEFSFDKALGDVSAYTGYQQAYVISGGHTVMGDGGGVCQVSTTFFRALLNAGLPITERHAHDYRVGYYEEGGYPPGIDATVYVPSVDLQFKNDSDHWILVQTIVDPVNLHLTFNLYGTRDGRQSVLTIPKISSQTAPPADLYQDDPTIPLGQIKQIDFSAWGANVSFSRTVTRNGKVILHDTYISNYRPWQAVFLRGTKQ